MLSMNNIARFVMYSLPLLSLLHIATCTVYTVTPDDHYNPNTTQRFQLQDIIRDNIPEVALNYCEYREPLVDVDC